MSGAVFDVPGISKFRTQLLAWFDRHKRDLPWRRSRDPYAIWISEIMLQQTRVAAVLEHYAKWMRRFPTVETLAAATEDEVLAAWSGLGYYRRARFLHKGAKLVAGEHGGRLPETAAALRGLPGIGAYTSAAIASIAYGEAVAVVDGNVERVLLRQTGRAENGAASESGKSRLEELNGAEIQQLAGKLLAPERPGDFNQAMMELGATVCLPRSPLCLQCPVQASCRTRGEHPIATRKRAVNLDIRYALLQRQGEVGVEVLLEQRAAASTVMPGMWELPRAPSSFDAEEAIPPLLTLRHAIMQTNYRVAVIAIRSEKALDGEGESNAVSGAAPSRSWVPVARLSALALTGLARKIVRRLEMLDRPLKR